VLEAARSLARARGLSLGAVLSQLARRGLAPEQRLGSSPSGFPTFTPGPDAPVLTVESVRAALDDEP